MALFVAIVEDSPDDLARLKDHLARYASETHLDGGLRISSFSNAEDFLKDYKPVYDVVLMDIELPGANGMSAARALRIVDPRAAIIFITNIASFAVSGYEVDALAYLIKPISHPAFSLAMRKAQAAAAARQARIYVIQTSDGIVRTPVSSILYVEVVRHSIYFHTLQGTYRQRGSMREVEEDLSGMHFCRCHNAYLVNLERVSSVNGNDVMVGGDVLPVSRQRKQDFLDALTVCLGV